MAETDSHDEDASRLTEQARFLDAPIGSHEHENDSEVSEGFDNKDLIPVQKMPKSNSRQTRNRDSQIPNFESSGPHSVHKPVVYCPLKEKYVTDVSIIVMGETAMLQ